MPDGATARETAAKRRDGTRRSISRRYRTTAAEDDPQAVGEHINDRRRDIGSTPTR